MENIDLLIYIFIIGGICCMIYDLYITFKKPKNKSVYNMDIMNMNMDDVIEEIDRICGYGEGGHVNKDVKSDD